MTPSDRQFWQDCETAFLRLNKLYLSKMAFMLGWTMDDIRQEFRLCCWEIHAGHARFCSDRGNVQEYFIGRLKNMLYSKGSLLPSNKIWESQELDEDTPEQNSLVDRLTAEKSACDALIEQQERQERQEQEEIHRALDEFLRSPPAARPSTKREWIHRLWHQGLSQMQISGISGFDQSHVSRILKTGALVKNR